MTPPRERRRMRRLLPQETSWRPVAVLRPGVEVEVLDLSAGGARIVSPARLKPGARAELHLVGATRRIVFARVGRCRVLAIAPMRYEGALVFEEWFDGVVRK
jgi:hypothetical protein